MGSTTALGYSAQKAPQPSASDAPYSFWLGDAGEQPEVIYRAHVVTGSKYVDLNASLRDNPLDGTRLWDNP